MEFRCFNTIHDSENNMKGQKEISIENSVMNNTQNIKEEKYGIISYIKSLRPLFLSHHPDCKYFNKHVLKIGKHKFCIGCYVGFPTAFISLIVISFYLDYLNHKSLFFWGVLLITTFLLSPLKLTNKKPIKIIQKILFNIGGAFLFWWIFRFPYSFYYNFLNFFLLFGILLTIVNAYHAYGSYRICKKCEYELDWDNCPGFREMRNHCELNNLPNLFKTQFKKNP